jgi:YggT family protein
MLPVLAASGGVRAIISQLLFLFEIALFGRVILSWFPISPDSPISSIYRVLYQITEPVLGPIRRMLPAMGGFDFSPIIVILLIGVIQRSL